MKLLTILGAMIADDTFREAVLDDPVGTAIEYGFQLTNLEADALTTMVANMDPEIFSRLAKEIRQPFCPHQICGFAPTMSRRREVYLKKKRPQAA